MEEIEKYGDLSDEELYKLLSEIEDCDDSIEESQAEADDKIREEEEQAELIESPENIEIESYYGEDAWRKISGAPIIYSPEVKTKLSRNVSDAMRQKSQKLKEDRVLIQREAFNQNFISLNDIIGSYNFQLLISILTKEHTRMVDKYSEYINHRLAIILNPLIPRKLRVCKMLYPESVRVSPGFLYRASEEYGQGKTFWAMPNVPYYFEQNTEQGVIAAARPELLNKIDKAVASLYYHKEQREKKEIKYGSKLIEKNVNSYFELLKVNPFWFKTLYDELKRREDESNNALNNDTNLPK